MEKEKSAFQRFGVTFVLWAVGLILAGFVLAGLFVSAHLGADSGRSEAITFVRLNIASSTILPILALGAVMLIKKSMEHCTYMSIGMAVLFTVVSLVVVWGLGAQQIYDAGTITEAARLFAQGNYKMMESDYLNVYSYQLGMCLPMEILLRIFKGADLNMMMQCINVFLTAGTGLVLTKVAKRLLPGSQKACAALCLLVVPAPLYCMHVYGTLPMLFFGTLAILFFLDYMRTQQARFGWGYAVMLAAAYMLKPNAAILVIALAICSALDAVQKRKFRPLMFAAISVVLSILLMQGVIWQYEWRSGVQLREDISPQARFLMGLQDGGGAAGWYNGYTEQFFPKDSQETAVVSEDLSARLAQMGADPKMTMCFFGEKLLSQWIEPTYGTFWQGMMTAQSGAEWAGTSAGHTGPLANWAALYEEGNPIKAAAEMMAHGGQWVLYVLALLGVVSVFGRRDDTAQAILPLIFLGGVLYHLLFEAKSQYAYPYIVYMLPVAAQGLCFFEKRLGRRGERSS